MTRLGIVLGLVIEALNEENMLGALKIECLSKAIYLLFQFAFKIFFLMSVLLLYEENIYF